MAISDREISRKFDVFYNNIMSSSAPGLTEYEKSVFLNKAQLEVLKNRLNPKGNKYGEGYDGSVKRQVDFSSLTVRESYSLFPQRSDDSGTVAWAAVTVKMVPPVTTGGNPTFEVVTCGVPDSSMLAVLNESIGVVYDKVDYYIDLAKALMTGDAIGFDFDEDGDVDMGDITAGIDKQTHGDIPKWVDLYKVINYLLDSSNESDVFVLKNPKTSDEIIKEFDIPVKSLVVVPLNYVEFDTLMSRPYKYPPRSQAWRIFVNGTSEFVLAPNMVPYKYTVRYVKTPVEFDLVNGTVSDIPEVLIDEVIQRAVELAKAAYIGDANQQQIIQTLGERSE